MDTNCYTIIGNISAGKSTIATALAKKLSANQIKADELYKTNPFFEDALHDRARWSLTSDIWFLKERVKLFQAHFHNNSANKPKPTVVDSGIAMSWVYANSRQFNQTMTNNEWQLYQELYATLTHQLSIPQTYIFLQTSVDHLLERMTKRGRAFELKHHSREYLESLNFGLNNFVKQLAPESLIRVDVSDGASVEEVVEEIVKNIKKLMIKK